MERISNERFNEIYYLEHLDNGLTVVLFHKPGYQQSFFIMGTPYGANDFKQIDDSGLVYEHPLGVAHFLEHKMFEKKNYDVMEAFSQLGANVNAFTSNTETAYYFSTMDDPQDPLNLLLDFTQKLEIDEASVEKEKGIIIQELEMYKQRPGSRIYTESLENTFAVHPLQYDVGGTPESVKAITLDDLNECYKLNYHPSRMVLVGVSGYEPQALMDTIKANQSAKSFEKVKKVKRYEYQEPLAIKKYEHTISMDIGTPRCAAIYKLSGNPNIHEVVQHEWALKIILDCYFTSLNPNYQEWIDREIINDSFSYEIDLGIDYGMIFFTCITEKREEFYQMLDQQFKAIKQVDNQEIERLKRRYFGKNVRDLDSFEQIAIIFLRSFFMNIDFYESFDVVETLDEQSIMDTFKQVDFNNRLKMTIMPSKDK